MAGSPGAAHGQTRSGSTERALKIAGQTRFPIAMLDQITPLIITYNEAPNIRRTLDKLRWARRIVVIDSGSTDGTVDLLRQYPQIEVMAHPFVDFASQCNFGLEYIATPWVLSLDADYELSDTLLKELAALGPAADTAGYRARFIYRIHGRPLRGTLYPPRTVLYRRARAAYHQEGHGHRVVVDGSVLPLRGVIFHDDRKPLARWTTAQQVYARAEADYLLLRQRDRLNGIDRLRCMAWPAPIAVLLYTLFVKGCVFDGWPGWFYALQRVIAETLLALEMMDRRLRAASGLVSGDSPKPLLKAMIDEDRSVLDD
jgi:glycosyltransferase involved in cell wall biosynthesis